MTKNEALQSVWRQYEEENSRLAATAREVCEWGVQKGLLNLPRVDPYDALAEDMARALREEYATDRQGRRYRVNHAVRITKGGVQYTFWAMLGYADRKHMQRAFIQRREQIVGDCVQLATDVLAYNDMNKDAEPLQMILDFTDDVAERLIADDDDKKAA
jgi:hypothetical protein